MSLKSLERKYVIVYDGKIFFFFILKRVAKKNYLKNPVFFIILVKGDTYDLLHRKSEIKKYQLPTKLI